jgi:RNA polymerase sigma factor FliA
VAATMPSERRFRAAEEVERGLPYTVAPRTDGQVLHASCWCSGRRRFTLNRTHESMNTSTQQRAYLELGDTLVRDRLLNENLGLVHHVARQLSRSLSVDADFDELVSAGTMGLMNALSSFDASRGLAFSTFAAPRIRGAILDELRRQDHVPRSVRRKGRDISAARDALMRTLKREPEDREVAAHLNVDLETYWRWRSETEGAVKVSLDRPMQDGDRRVAAPVDILPDTAERSIEDMLNLEQEVGILRGAIMELKEQERVVLSLYYFEELKLHEIASVLELTESRVSQIRSKAISKLRGQMAGLRQEVA